MRNIHILNTSEEITNEPVSTPEVSDTAAPDATSETTSVSDSTCAVNGTSCCTCAVEETTVQPDMDLAFTPGRFIENSGYMGVGMLGIFIVMGTLIIGTALLNKIMNRKSKK